MRIASVWLLAMSLASSASAQSAYVGASFIGDIVRVSGSSYGSGGNGETFGGALRVGAPLGERWGVELEFARSGRIETAPGVFPLAGFSWSSEVQGSVSVVRGGIPSIFPIPEFRNDRRLSTIGTMLWWNQEVSDRVSLVYLGGVAFTRTDWHVRIAYPRPLSFPGPSPIDPVLLPFPNIDQKSTAYDADIAVGFEGRIGMTEHVRLVPGIRMQTAAEGWAIRPGVGLQWAF